MKKIAAYLRPYLGRMSLGLLIKFIGTIMDLLLPWILATTIDHVVPTKSIPAILLWGGMMVVCSVVALVANIVANRMASRVARDTTRRIRHDLFDKIVRLSCRQVDGFSVPSLEARLTSDTYNIHQMIGMMQRLGVRAPILLLGGVLVTLTLEPVLTLVLLAVLPLIGFVIWRISKKGIPLYGELQKAVDRLIRSVREKASGIRVIKALSKEAYEKERFATVNQEVVDRETHAAVTMAASNPLMNLFLNLGLTLVIAVPIGVLAAIYMGEYAKKGKVLTTIRFCVESLAGIPSILYGLFGYTFFAIQLAFGFSLLSSALTLAIMVLPVIIRSTEEALFTVPDSYREGSLALGASKLTTLFRVILPSAIPGILSAIILSMGRVMGETAAVYYTAGTMARVPSSVFSSTRSLAVHLYMLVREGLETGDAYATATILIVIVVGLNALANFIAKRLSRKLTGGN